MRQTASGRWMPDKPPPPHGSAAADDVDGVRQLQAICRDAIAAGIEMPADWPLLMLQANIGREILRAENASNLP